MASADDNMATPAPSGLQRRASKIEIRRGRFTTTGAPKERCTLQIHSVDALRLDLSNGDSCEVASQGGVVATPVEVTDDIMPGVVSLPHGWGHDRRGARLDIARLHVGTNINELSPAEMIDTASGNAVLNGIPVTVRRLA